jgi:hypothetical protein
LAAAVQKPLACSKRALRLLKRKLASFFALVRFCGDVAGEFSGGQEQREVYVSFALYGFRFGAANSQI